MIRRYVAPVCCVLNVNNKKIVKTACTLRLGLHYCDAGTVQFQYRFPPRIYLIVCTHCPMRSMAGVNKKMMTPPDQIAVPTVKWCRNRFSWVWTPMRSYSIVDKKKKGPTQFWTVCNANSAIQSVWLNTPHTDIAYNLHSNAVKNHMLCLTSL